MASIISKYSTVGGVIPAAAFKSAFLFCFVTLIIGLVVFATQKEKPAASGDSSDQMRRTDPGEVEVYCSEYKWGGYPHKVGNDSGKNKEEEE